MVLKMFTVLVHLDLSWNSFTFEECVMIGEALENNQTLFGLHFAGHYSHVDHLGFLVINENTT